MSVTLTDRQSILALFGLNAVLNGGLFARLPEVQRALDLSEQQFGLALAALSAGVMAAMQVAPRIAARVGTRRMILGSFISASLLPPLFGILPSFALLVAVTGLLGFLSAIAGAAMNVEADRVARSSGRPLMSLSHGTWSLVFMVVTGISALAIRAGVTPIQQFVTITVVMLAGIQILIRPMPESEAEPGGTASPRFVLPNRATFLLMGFGLISVVVEIVVRNWSIVIVRDIFAPPGWIAATALPLFIGLQTAGRLLADRVAARIGDVALGRAFCVMTAAGLIMLALSPSVWTALFSCAVIGLGTSATYPLVITAVVRRGDRPATEAVAAFIFLQNILSALSPVLFGTVAGLTDPRLAVALLLPVVAVSFAFTRELGPQAGSEGVLSSRA